jgi:hypothetical protein
MKQLTLAQQGEFEGHSKKIRRKQLLEEMGTVMHWAKLLALVAPHFSKGEADREPVCF